VPHKSRALDDGALEVLSCYCYYHYFYFPRDPFEHPPYRDLQHSREITFLEWFAFVICMGVLDFFQGGAKLEDSEGLRGISV